MRIHRIAVALSILLMILVGTSSVLAQDQAHTIETGQTLYSIARQYGVTVQQLSFANGITNPELIYVGQVLVIPDTSGGDGVAGTADETDDGSETVTTPFIHYVQAGDTLFSIARKWGLSYSELLALNDPISNVDSLSIGQPIIVALRNDTLPDDDPPPPPISDDEITHTIAAGETLGQIALRYETTTQQIVLLNNLTNPNLIYLGQVLIIRQGTAPTELPDDPTDEPTDDAPTGEQSHTVAAGQTLSTIARLYGVTVEQITFANGITNPELIFVGQVLVIPDTSGGDPSDGGDGDIETPDEPDDTAPSTYTVVAGDTLFSIARRFGVSAADLVALNNLSNADSLDVGQVLALSGGTGGSNPTPPSDDEITHTVAAGETLGQIALRYGTTSQQIALLNDLTNPNLIFLGQVLIIRQGSAPTGEPTEEPTEEPTAEITEEPTAVATEEPTTEVTEEPTAEVTEEPTAVVTEEPTAEVTEEPTAVVTEEPTEEPIDDDPTPTPIVPPDSANLFTNPGFEGSVRKVVFNEVQVVEGWEPFYCDEPYTPEKCPAPRQGSGNPDGLVMRRPEFKQTDVDNRVRSGNTAQQWFCFLGTCRAGVYQTVDTVPGAECEAGAYVQTLSADGNIVSDISTKDQRDNSTWMIRVNLTGDTFAFSESNLTSRAFSFADGHYDKYAKITFNFTANSTKTTIFFENLRLWPIANNDSYIDDAYVRCN